MRQNYAIIKIQVTELVYEQTANYLNSESKQYGKKPPSFYVRTLITRKVLRSKDAQYNAKLWNYLNFISDDLRSLWARSNLHANQRKVFTVWPPTQVFFIYLSNYYLVIYFYFKNSESQRKQLNENGFCDYSCVHLREILWVWSVYVSSACDYRYLRRLAYRLVRDFSERIAQDSFFFLHYAVHVLKSGYFRPWANDFSLRHFVILWSFLEP